MRSLTESLLALARIDAGQGTKRRERLDLGQAVRDCVELLRPLANERQVTLRCDLQPSECLGDSEQLAQVITNLVTNAVVHNKSGGEATISTRREQEWAILTVADTGPGIPTEDLQRIFERFYRADKSRSGATGGTGLGLAISKAIVEAHGGNVEVAAEQGTGSTFTVRLPADRQRS